MKTSDEKISMAQITLYEDILSADNIIKYQMNCAVNKILKELVESKYPIKDGQETVEFTVEEFNKLWSVLNNLSKSETMHKEFDSWVNSDYIKPREEKIKILHILK